MNEQVPSKDQVSYLLAKLCWHTCTCQNAMSPSVQHGVYCVYEQARASMPTHEPPAGQDGVAQSPESIENVRVALQDYDDEFDGCSESRLYDHALALGQEVKRLRARLAIAKAARASQPPEPVRLTDWHCDEIITALEAYEFTGFSRDDIRLIAGRIDTYRAIPTKRPNLPEIPPDSMPPDPGPDPTKLEYDEWVARTKECPACHGQGCEPHECDDGRLIQGPTCERCEGAGRVP